MPVEGNETQSTLDTRLKESLTSPDEITEMIRQLELWLVAQPHIWDQVRVINMKIGQVLLENPWDQQIIELAAMKTKDLKLAIDKTEFARIAKVEWHTHKAANDDNYA